MQSNVALHTSAALGSIVTAFPPHLKLQAEGLDLVMGSTNFATHQGIEVKVGEDHLVIPYRIHHQGDEEAGKSLAAVQGIMYACRQRCGQGYVRAMRVRSTQISLWVYEECEATWKSQADVNVSKFENYGTMMADIGRSGLWSELEQQ